MGILDFWSIGVDGLLKRVLLLTGSPGVGKTTVLMKTINELKEAGYRVGGMISREVREGGTRVGFEILDLNSSKRGWLAHVNE
jgi:nucleoside-triphosphatase